MISTQSHLPCQRESPNTQQPTEDILPCSNLELIESNFSNDHSFYNAIRASSSSGEAASKLDSGYIINEGLDGRIAANMAMFFPLPSERLPGSSWQDKPQYTANEANSEPIVSSGHCLLSALKGQIGGSLPNMQLKLSFLEENRRRRVASLNDTDNTTQGPKWPGNLPSPVCPALPRYPPPIRSPTPPGLPSFGTREAISYTSRFADPSTNPQPRIARNPRPASYGEVLRRLLGLTPTPSSALPIRQTSTIRADDGTAILGRFPLRQSGHGTAVTRRIDEHPFHQRSLSIAQCDGSSDSPAVPVNKRNTRNPHYVNNQPPFANNISSIEEITDMCPPGTPNTANLNGQLFPLGRTDSFRTCHSRIPETSTPRLTNEPATDGSHPNDGTAGFFFLAPMQSTDEGNSFHNRALQAESQGGSWLLFLKEIISFYCCCRLKTEAGSGDTGNLNTSSNETYLTALTRTSNEGITVISSSNATYF